MDLTNLASYEVMKRWTDRMFAIFAQPAAPGFQKVSQAQLLRADHQAFIRLMKPSWFIEGYASSREAIGPHD